MFGRLRDPRSKTNEVDTRQKKYSAFLRSRPLEGGVVVNAGRSTPNELSHALSFRTFLGEVTDHTVVTAAKQTGHVMSGGLPKLQDKEHSDQFGEAIKAEVELLVLL